MRCFLIGFLLSLLLSRFAYATDYYVDPGGNDDADGTSEKSAWKTLGRVERQPLEPGDSINLRAGATWHESIRLTRSGTPQKPISLRGYGAGPATSYPTISGADETGKPVRDYCLDIAASHVVIVGIEFTAAANPQRGAIMIWADQDRTDITIARCRISESRGRGIWVAGDDAKTVSKLLISGCEFLKNDGSGIQISKMAGLSISGNRFSGNCRKPVDEWQAAIRLWSADVSNVRISQNRIGDQLFGLDRGAGMGIHIDEVGAGVSVGNNDIFDCDGSGIVVENTRGVEVSFNVIANVATGIFAYRAGHDHNIHRNAIFARELGIVLQGHRANGVNAGPEILVKENLFTNNRVESNVAITEKYSPLKVIGGAEQASGALINKIGNNAFGPPKPNLVEWGPGLLSSYAELEKMVGAKQDGELDVKFARRKDGEGWERIDANKGLLPAGARRSD
ncbi:MAG: right-handed parallel beta-helix repeat-containing protein [Burkholderiales bacterium]|nr:right-handed parallel beta-helix repeat-containing protein [Phycisphaerae bacterium]